MPSPRNYSRQEVDAIYERVRLIDPDLVAAAEEQDSELIHWYSSLEPKQRLRRGVRAGEAFQRLRDARKP